MKKFVRLLLDTLLFLLPSAVMAVEEVRRKEARQDVQARGQSARTS